MFGIKLTESNLYVQPVMYEIYIKYTFCIICWSLDTYQFEYVTNCIVQYRFYINNDIMIYAPNFIYYYQRCKKTHAPNARHQSGLSPRGIVPTIAIWAVRNITFPVLGPMSYPCRRMQPSILEVGSSRVVSERIDGVADTPLPSSLDGWIRGHEPNQDVHGSVAPSILSRYR